MTDKRGVTGATKTTTNSGKSRLSTVRGRATSSTTCEWCCVDPKALVHAVAVVQANGGAMLLGATRDGGALVVTVLLGNDTEKFYAKNASEANDVLNDLAKVLSQDILPEVAASIVDKIAQYS